MHEFQGFFSLYCTDAIERYLFKNFSVFIIQETRITAFQNSSVFYFHVIISAFRKEPGRNPAQRC